MKEFKRGGLRLQVLYFLAVTWFLFPVTGQSADVLAPAQGTVTASAGMQEGTGLTRDEVVRTALKNHSSVKSAQYQVGAQDAVLHQQMAAYYPTLSFSNTYRTANSGVSSSNASKGFDSFTGAGNASMTLYNSVNAKERYNR